MGELEKAFRILETQGVVRERRKRGFYSPCTCGKFEPKESTGWAEWQTVCANCGCHEPKGEVK